MSSPTTSPRAQASRSLALLTQGQPVQMANGTLEALKWLALLLMTLDHVNKYVFAWGLPGVVEAGRLVVPIFGFVLAYNLARTDLGAAGIRRVSARLLVYAALATPVYVVLNTGLLHRLHPELADRGMMWWPLNILFTLLLATVVIGLIERRQPIWRAVAMACFVLAGTMVEYAWFGVGFVVASWYHCRRGSALSAALVLLAAIGLTAINDNFYALLALPLLLLATRLDLSVPRWPHVFYLYYPLHLLAIWGWLHGPAFLMELRA